MKHKLHKTLLCLLGLPGFGEKDGAVILNQNENIVEPPYKYNKTKITMRYNYLNIVNYNEYFQLNSPSLQALNLENNSAMKNT